MKIKYLYINLNSKIKLRLNIQSSYFRGHMSSYSNKDEQSNVFCLISVMPRSSSSNWDPFLHITNTEEKASPSLQEPEI